MTPTVDEATIISLDAVSAGAMAVADAFGLGDSTEHSTDWPIDDGDTVLAATIEGGLSGTLLLAVNDDVAGRLASDGSRLRGGFQRALDAIAAAAGVTAAIEILDVGETATTPAVSVEIHDGKQLCALFGFAPAEVTPGTPGGAPDGAAAPQVDGAPDDAVRAQVPGGPAAVFEPAPLADGGRAVTTPSMGPLTLLQEVEMDVTVELGRTRMPIRELLALQPGMVVEIDRVAGAPIDVLVNGRAIACGEVVVIDEEFGIRITEIVDSGARL